MRKKSQLLILFLFIISTNVVLGKNGNKRKTLNAPHKNHNVLKGKSDTNRIKRSLNDIEGAPFWPNRGKRQNDDKNYNPKYEIGLDNNQKFFKDNKELLIESPFWGNRGRRDSSSIENVLESEYPEYNDRYCEHCSEIDFKPIKYRNLKDFVYPFWGSRGRRQSDEVENLSSPFWGNRGKKQEKEELLGNKGQRTEESPFWGNRGRREDEPFWGNRGRREDQEPFWGNRGRRQDNDPFWGNRGKREEEPFWGNRGRRKDSDLTNQNMKEDLKDSILKAISDVENDTEYLSRLKKRNIDPNSFWANRGRDSKLKFHFNRPLKSKTLPQKPYKLLKISEPGTILDNRMYVDEPNYILVERSSRSSGEDDPYYISRGKKYYAYNNAKATRDRRGAIEELVKSVRNDPYHIARGKKGFANIKNSNSSVHRNEFDKVKDLICSAIDLLMIKNNDVKVKREINDNDRDRRTILKKLAAQLQMDPYFVSRGKKSEAVLDEDNLQEFTNIIADKCNSVV